MIPWECTSPLYIIVLFRSINYLFITVRLDLPEPSEEEKNTCLQEDRRTIRSALDNCLPPIIGPEEPRTVHDVSKNDVLEFQTLISLRRSHQRRQAQTGTRHKQANQTQKNTSETSIAQPGSESSSGSYQTQASPSSNPTPELKLSRGDLLREFQAVIKAQEERGVATAVGRKVRWESRQPGRQSAADVETASRPSHGGNVTGNSANARQVAENEAKKVGHYIYYLL